MQEFIEKLAFGRGFAQTRFFPLLPLPRWRRNAEAWGLCHGMPFDLRGAFPWAKCVIFLVWAYGPFPPGQRVSPYYLASNQAYHASKALAADVTAQGFRCEPAFLPARALALACGAGQPGRNGLLSIAPYGTRVALFTLVTNACDPADAALPGLPCPADCQACIRACPGGAISIQGLDVTKCLRYHMDAPIRPDLIKELQATFLGCEICQAACPKNAGLSPVSPPEEALRAFDLLRLIRGDASAARALVGRNMTSGGKLTGEAIVFAAKDGLYEAEIRECLSSPFPAVQQAAQWALNRFETKRSENIIKV